jgi:benzoyl-CoA reductase subunit A
MSEFNSMKKDHKRENDKVIVAGVDVGSVNSKAVILINSEPISFSEIRSQAPKESAVRVINEALCRINLNLEDINYTVATGCGKKEVSFAQKAISEISCAAKGAIKIWGQSVRTVLDVGGESCKVIHCTESGRVIDFLWNDKCASGIGFSFDSLAYLLNKELKEIGKIGSEVDKFPEISDFCVVYARSEAFDLIRDKIPIEKIIAAYHYAMARRMAVLVERLGLKEDFVVIGGMSRNQGIMVWLERILKQKPIEPKIKLDPTFSVAFGAALFADSFYRQSKI